MSESQSDKKERKSEENEDGELPASELGTKEYWDKSYEQEIKNYKNYGDVGEVWFDEDSQIRIINWILKENKITQDKSIVDLGCGNGMLLIELAREGFKNLVGLDYSENAIELAINVARDQQLNIEFFLADILSESFASKFGKFFIVHDKGTYDAISLHPENPGEKRETYINNICKILDENGFYIITSCNWTEDELIFSFSNKLNKYFTIPTPTFKFGGKIGNVVTSIVFKKTINC